MRTIVALQHRCLRTPDGAVWSEGWLDYGFWGRYLEVFDTVRVVCRVLDVPVAPAGAHRVDGPRVETFAVPHYRGPWQYARRYRRVRRALRGAVMRTDAVILRVPSVIAGGLISILQPGGHPYGVEVVGDPLDVYKPGGVRTLLRPLLRWWGPRQVRRQCAGACAAAYVTAETLQRRYPPAPGAYTTHYSSAELPDEAFAVEPRGARRADGPFRLVLVGSLEQMYKAPDVLIGAVAAVVRGGADLHLTIVGDGRHRPELERLAADCGVAERVWFAGKLPGAARVRAELDAADLFVLPSRTEGLPRAMIEAMARGLPCIGSAVGGIPELLDATELFPPDDVDALAARIREVARDPQRQARLSARNLERAREYHADVLRARRRTFYEAVRDATAAWRREAGSDRGINRPADADQ